MSLFDSSSIWNDFQKPQDVNPDRFFEAKAYENLFSELRMPHSDEKPDEDDNSTNAPESRTTSNMINANQLASLVKIREKPLAGAKHIMLKASIRLLLDRPIDQELRARFGKVIEWEQTIDVKR